MAGLMAVSELVEDATDLGDGSGQFVVPSLRDVAKTSPYFHDGSVQSLGEVVALYDAGSAHLGPDVSPVTSRPLGLTQPERDALVAFLESLSSPNQ